MRLSTELPESKHGEQEKTTLERVEAFYEEALKERLNTTLNKFLYRYMVWLLNNNKLIISDAQVQF